jgi:hypothetical protein
MREDLILCDYCRDRIKNAECDPLQMRFILHETMDDGMEYHFCGAECLKNFVSKKEFETRFYRWGKPKEKV